MKKRYLALLTAAVCLTSFPVATISVGNPFFVCAEEEESGPIFSYNGLFYESTDSYSILVGCEDKTVTSITVPDVVNGKRVSMSLSKGNIPFSDCPNLEAIYVDENNTAICSVDGVVLDKEQKFLICCPPAKKGTYVVPETVDYITPYSFRLCNNLSKIILPESMLEIREYAFEGCNNLKEIVNPAPFKDMNALNACINLERVELAEGLKFDYFRITDCMSLKELIIPDSMRVSKGINIQYCNALSSLDLSPILLTGDAISVKVSYCPNLTEVIMPDKVQYGSLGQMDISNCEKLEKIVMPEESQSLQIEYCDNTALYTDSASLQATAEELGVPWHPLSQEYLLYGDVNQDGKVDLTDCITLSKVNSKIVELSESQQKAADCDANGTVNDKDGAILLEFVLMLLPNLPYIEG